MNFTKVNKPALLTRRSLLAASIPFSRAVAANDGVGILAIGVRNRGRAIAVAAASFGRVVAACDVDEASFARLFEKLDPRQPQRPALYKDYRKALERHDVDVVTIGAPDHWHTAILIAALRAGKDVYCEKPMTLTIDEGKKICQVVRRTGRVVQVGTQQRTEFERRFLKAVALARSGRLGRRLKATCHIGRGKSGGPFPAAAPPATLDWDFWLGQAPKVPYTPERCHASFRWWYHYSGGKMTDWGAHHIDIAQWALGVENTGPVLIQGKGKLPLGRRRTLKLVTGKLAPDQVPNMFNTATEFEVKMKFANGNELVVRHGPGNGIWLEGERDRIFVSRKELTGRLIDEIQSDPAAADRLEDDVIRLYQGREPTTHMAGFIECVRRRATPISDVFTHHRSVSSCHLANIALLRGHPLHWDPETQRFRGDEVANSLLARPQRAPYLLPA